MRTALEAAWKLVLNSEVTHLWMLVDRQTQLSAEPERFCDSYPLPIAQVGHRHRAPSVCRAVPAAVFPTAQLQCVWAGGTRASAIPPQHELEHLAHLHQRCHSYRGEVISTLTPVYGSQSGILTLRSRNWLTKTQLCLTLPSLHKFALGESLLLGLIDF